MQLWGLDRSPVLVVEDDDAVRALIQTVLHRHGVRSDGARDGSEALDLIDKRRYRVVLLDLMMPRIDGIQFLRVLSERSTEGQPLVIVMTAAAEELTRKLDASQVHAFVRKPFEVDEMVEIVRAAVESEIPG